MKLFCIMGLSGAGKDAIVSKILSTYCDFERLVYWTNRGMRPGEVDGYTYHFGSEASYVTQLKQGKVLEVRAYDTRDKKLYYWTNSDDLKDNSVYVVSACYSQVEAYVEKLGSGCVYPILIQVQDYILLRRLLDRTRDTTCDYYEMCRRYVCDRDDTDNYVFPEGTYIHKVSNNGSLEDCFTKVDKYIKSILI